MMYLNPRQAVAMADTLKELAAPGSALVHEGLGGSGYQAPLTNSPSIPIVFHLSFLSM